MLKISKIEEKEIIEVLEQKNCSHPDKDKTYTPWQDCLDDCTATGRPNWYESKLT